MQTFLVTIRVVPGAAVPITEGDVREAMAEVLGDVDFGTAEVVGCEEERRVNPFAASLATTRRGNPLEVIDLAELEEEARRRPWE